jgi:hypothetical protein
MPPLAENEETHRSGVLLSPEPVRRLSVYLVQHAIDAEGYGGARWDRGRRDKIVSATTAGLVSPDRMKGGRGDLLRLRVMTENKGSGT